MTQDPQENPITEHPKGDPITEDTRMDSITGDPKENPITEDPLRTRDPVLKTTPHCRNLEASFILFQLFQALNLFCNPFFS